MKVPDKIKTLIKDIESLEASTNALWNRLYEWFESNNIEYLDETSMAFDVVANLQGGIGAEALIEWLESK